MKKQLMIGLGFAAVAILGMAVALPFRDTSQSAEELAGLSDQEKLEILNSGDEKAIIELMEAEESLQRAVFEKQRLEAEDIRADSKKRAELYWADFKVSNIDLTGLDFRLLASGSAIEQRERLSEAVPGVTDFERAAHITYTDDKIDCGDDKYSSTREYLSTAPALPLKHDEFDMPRVSDYLADRASLQTGDCSCATKVVPPEKSYQLLQRIMTSPGQETLKSDQQDNAVALIGIHFSESLKKEREAFCKTGR